MAKDETVEVAEEKVNVEKKPSQWDDDFNQDDLAIPYKREEVEADVKTDDEKDDKEVETPEEAETVEELGEVEPIVTTNDPGEYTPKDYSFEIELEGETHTLTTVKQAEKFADDHAEELSSKQVIDLLRKTSKMESNLERDKEKWEADKEKFDEQSKAEQERSQNVEALANEMNYLVSKGLVPGTAKQYANADWADPEVAKQPGVKDQIELLNYMVKENASRIKAGLAPLTSMIDVFNSWKLEQKDTEEEDKEEKENQARKKAGAKVAGVSSSGGNFKAPKGIAIGDPNKLKNRAAIWDD